jgi:hypothetical protein
MLSAGQVHSLLGDLKADLKTALGDKLEELVLFGSYSRGCNCRRAGSEIFFEI